MKLKKLLSFALALAMVLAFIPAMSLTASAAEEQTLWDINTLGLVSGGSEITPSSTYGLTSSGWVRFNTGNWVNGVWTSGDTYDTVLTFFKSTDRSSTNLTEYVTFDNAALTKGAESVTIDFAFATRDGYISNYETFSFYDNDGNAFASFYFDNGTEANNAQFRVGVDSANYYYLVADNDSSDDRDAVNALRGVDFRIKAEKGTSGYTVTYSYDPDADGVYTAFATEAIDSVNGIWKIEDVIGGWTSTWCGAGLQDLVVKYVMPDTTKTVTATYTLNGTTIDTATATYDTSTGATAASFDAKYYSVNGENVLYGAAATELSESQEVPMSAISNNDVNNYSKGASVTVNGTAYIINSDNLIPNGDFYYGINGWFAGDGNAATSSNFTANGDGTATIVNNNGSSSAAALQRSWTIEANKTYLFTYSQDCSTSDAAWQRLSLNNSFDNNSSAMLIGSEAGVTPSVGTNIAVFENTGAYTYLNYRAGYSGGVTVGNFGLYEIEVDTSVKYYNVSYAYEDGTVIYEDPTAVASGTVIAARTFYADGKIYTTPETTVADSDVVIKATVAQEYAVLTDALVSDNEIWGPLQANSNGVFVAAGADANRGPLSDADGVSVTDAGINPSTLQKSRVGFMQFALPELTDGQTAQLVMPVYDWHDNTFSNGNTSIRIAAYVMEDDSWTTLADGESYTSSTVTTIGEAIFSDVAYSTSDYITMDVTDAVKRAKAAGLSSLILRLNTAWGAAYISDSESAVFGGSREGLASYIAISDGGYTVTVDDASYITVNGSKMSDTTATVNDGDYIYAYGSDYYYEATTGTVYDGSTKIDVTSDLDLTGMSLGVDLLNGAQIRIGNGVDDENKLLTESGLRFIATVGTTNTLAGVADEIGIAISADDTFETTDTLVPADKYQDTSVFTVAVTNIKEANYNTVYYAIPYVEIGGKYYTGASVARTPYQVAAGILVADNGDGTLNDGTEDYTQTDVENDALYAVLNAYVNVTGARITLDSEYKVGYATYANGADEFFTYSDAVDNGDGTYTITLTAIGNATFYDYADEYYRINNAKEDKIKASADIDDITTVINGSTMEITFTPATTAAAE